MSVRKTVGVWTLGLAVLSAHAEETGNLQFRSPQQAAIYVLDGQISLDGLATLHGSDILYHLPGTPPESGATTINRYRLLGYSNQALHLDPGKYHLYAVTGDDVLPFDTEIGTAAQTWSIQPRNQFLLGTGSTLVIYSLVAVPLAIGPTYVDAVRGRGFSSGAIALTSGAAAFALGAWMLSGSEPRIEQLHG